MVEKNKSKKSIKKNKDSVSKDKNIKKSNKELKKDMKKMNSKKKKGKVKKIILISFLIIILLGIIAVGAVIGMIFSEFSDDWVMKKEDLVLGESNSKVVDSEGNLLAIITGDENRQPIPLNEMSVYLPKAYVAIEDERFYEHSGIDIQRTLGAVLQYVKGNSSYGGSTITQQVVKNVTKDDERAIERKIKEWGRAYNVEQILSKDEILQLYLNLIYVGGPVGQSLHGVEVAANYYFNKSAKDLTLAESAYLAGINSSPSYYRPFENLDENGAMPEDMQKRINNKVKTVLAKMKELGTGHKAGISEEEYNTAVSEVEAGIKFSKGVTRTELYSFHTELALNEVIEDYMEKKECSREFAETYVYGSGLTIHTTQVSSIQEAIEKEYTGDDIVILTSKETKDKDGNFVTSQSAMVIIDHTNGRVVGCVGQIGEKTTNFSLNRVTSVRQTGSSMKPLAVIVPGVAEGIITAGSVYDDVPTTFGGKRVINHYYAYRGLSTVRSVIEESGNVIPAKIITEMTPSKSIEYLEKLGITTVDRELDDSYSLALGGLTYGVSPLEMAGAYATIANYGVYIEPTFYTKVEDANGVILESKQESHRVISEENAYVVQSILTQPVLGASGTAGYCKISGMETCAKTGTTDSHKDRWLCGFTPYYTAAVWYGYDMPENLRYSYNPGSYIFKRVMAEIHEELPNKNFTAPENVVKVAICKDSGLLPGEHCKETVEGNRVYTEVFVKGTVPSKTCDVHVKAKVCLVSGEGEEPVYELANDNCPEAVELTFITRPNSDTNTAWQEADDAKYMLPRNVCERHKEEPDTEAPVITIKGEEKITLKVGDKYEDKGATAIDEKDGDLTQKIEVTGKVDTSKEGTYLITYTVEDNAKNKATKTRKIIVEKKKTETNKEPSDNKIETPTTNTVNPDTNTVNPDANTVKPDTNTVNTSGNTVNEEKNTVTSSNTVD